MTRDGKQVEPARATQIIALAPCPKHRAKPPGRCEPRAQIPSWLGATSPNRKPDIRKQSYLTTVNRNACKPGGVHIRDLAAWLGLTPREHSSGGKQRLGGISKQGDTYVRTLLIHGARAALNAAVNKTDPRSRWVTALAARRNKNMATVALANKNARVAWAILARGEAYRAAM